MLLVSVKLLPFRGEPEVPRSRELLEFVTGEGTKCKIVGCSFTTDVMHQFISARIIQFVLQI